MSLNGSWETKEDFERDLLLFAEFSVSAELEDIPKKVMEPESPFDVPDTIRNYEKRMEENKQSLVAGTTFDEGLTYFVSGRGRGVIDRVIRPGVPVKPDPSDDVELKRMIRQVSGLGYSNELIERHIQAKYEENEAKAAAGTSSDSSVGVCKPKTSLDLSASSSSVSSALKDPKEKNNDMPKRQMAQKKGKKHTSSYASTVKSAKGKESPQWFDSYARPKGYNLDSDFPPLK